MNIENKIKELRKELASWDEDVEILEGMLKRNGISSKEKEWIAANIKRSQFKAAQIAQLIYNLERELFFIETLDK